ncbi:Nn.00g046440.m01.CDS01 [Neocucurbitaria sp. VM-36]
MERAQLRHTYEQPRLLDQDVMERPAVANTKVQEANGHDRSPSIDDLVRTFLDNTKYRFGEHSVEVNTINAILSTFRNGEMSKRDALSSITLTLRDQDDIKRDLMNVLYHKDAKWGAGDFDFDPLVTQPCPQFLQPAHEPQLRLPSISSLCYSDHQAVPSINPAVLSGYSGKSGFANDEYLEPIFPQNRNTTWKALPQLSSSPQWQMPIGYHFSHRPTVSHSGAMLPYTTASNEASVSPAHQDFTSMAQHNRLQEDWGSTDYGEEYATALSTNTDAPAGTSPSVLGNPFTVPLGRPAVDMPPPPKKRTHQGFIAQVNNEQQHGGDAVEAPSLSSPPTTLNAKATVARQPKKRQSNTAKLARSCPEEGPFIHSLCGKGFTSRSKVKKHHWGAKYDDLNTKTGCWAKHNKPNISWNLHPSCREETSAERAFKKVSSQSTLSLYPSEQKAPMVPALIPSDNTIPGFPILQDLPQAVAQTLTSTTQYSFENIGAYPSHRLPARSSFESLLTAVNVASRIDAPKPQGRNDSVVSQLDAQAVAAERDMRYTPIWIEPSRGNEKDSIRYKDDLIMANGLGISCSNREMQVPLEMDHPTQMGEGVYHSSSATPTDAN